MIPPTNSLVIPVYRNEENIPTLLEELSGIAGSLSAPLEVVFVVDGSPDASYELLRSTFSETAPPYVVVLVRHARNFGSFAAIRRGMSIASGARIAVMAADCQEPPSLVVEFFQTLASEPVDVVLGVRASRADPFLSRLASSIYWGLYSRLIQAEMPSGGVDVFACRSEVRDVLVGLSEANSSLVGQLCWVGYRRKLVSYDRRAREHGKSAWTLPRKLRYMLNSAFGFSDLPINLLLAVGTLGLLASLGLSIVVFVSWWFSLIEVKGYVPLMLTILASTSLNVLCLGILGSYIWRTFENTKGRPLSLELSREHFSAGGLAGGEDLTPSLSEDDS
ncbi:MAG: glycosyltransferase family 2 protein [Planctomycetes bacterium]|nr:glycosyltransferase family 2 protein [Planctomycetota bacterium]